MGLFLLGILGGIFLSLFFSFGPAFFSQIQASIHYGFRNAYPFALGVSTSDVTIVAILLLISRNIPIDQTIAILSNHWIIYLGAAVIAGFGLYTMLLKTRRATEVSESDRISPLTASIPRRFIIYLRGILLNIFNPLIWVYWTTIVAILICNDSEITIAQRYLFFGGVLSATLTMDILKCKLASLLQRMITYRFLNIFNKSVGVILIAFSIFMVVSTIPRFERENSQKPAQIMQEVLNTKPPTTKLFR